MLCVWERAQCRSFLVLSQKQVGDSDSLLNTKFALRTWWPSNLTANFQEDQNGKLLRFEVNFHLPSITSKDQMPKNLTVATRKYRLWRKTITVKEEEIQWHLARKADGTIVRELSQFYRDAKPSYPLHLCGLWELNLSRPQVVHLQNGNDSNNMASQGGEFIDKRAGHL